MRIAVQFGAGNIGRGFMGQLFWEAGYTTCFVEYNSDLATKLNERKQYPLRLLDAYSKQHIDLTITQIHALTTEDVQKIAEVLSQADIIATAVGVKSLEQIAPLIAAGVKLRYQQKTPPVDIYLCENLYEAAGMLKKAVQQCLDSETAAWAEEHIGFVGTSVARMVPAASGRFGVQDPLFVVADSYHKLAYDGPARRGNEPDIQGMYAVKNFRAEVERKLFTHNLGHAALAYLGYLKGYTYVHEPFDDPELCAIFNGALDETTEALLKRYPDDLDASEHADIRKDVNIRFSNPLVLDTVQRVARDPIRKLGPHDRLIGSAKLCLQYGIFPKHIALICGAALCYDYSEDPDAVKLQKMIADISAAQTLQQVSGVNPTTAFGQEIIKAYGELQKKSALTPQ